jgi:CheY-like chemotaxis protein
MKQLEYKIIWIDDQPDKAQGYSARIASLLGRYGLELNVQWVSDKEGLNSFLAGLNGHDDYDMIMVDWKLGQMTSNGNGGASVAHEIRARHSFAMIVFYSAEQPGTLRNQIAAQLIDGVYCVNRTHFFEEASPLVKSSLKRFCDFNGMRGLFLAATAEFDDIIQGATFKAFNNLPEDYRQQIINKLLDGRVAYASKQLEDAGSHARPSDLASVIKAIRPSSWELYQCLVLILSFISAPSPKHTQALNILQQYEDQVITPRNDMAHLKEKMKDGQKVIVRGEREWDTTKFDGLRQALADHNSNLIYIRDCLLDELIKVVRDSEATQKQVVS